MARWTQTTGVGDVKMTFCCQLWQTSMPSVLWHGWLGGRKGIRPVKNWVVCWRGYLSGAMCRFAYMAQLMPLLLTVSCFSKIQIVFNILVPAHLGSPGQRAVKRVCMLWQTRNQLLIGYLRSLIVTVPQVVAILDVVAGSMVFHHVLPHVDPAKLSHATTHIMSLQQTFPLMRMMITFLLWFEPLEALDRRTTSDHFSFQSNVSHLCL